MKVSRHSLFEWPPQEAGGKPTLRPLQLRCTVICVERDQWPSTGLSISRRKRESSGEGFEWKKRDFFPQWRVMVRQERRQVWLAPEGNNPAKARCFFDSANQRVRCWATS